jgi:serine/threonine protein phosphatase PrpC
MGGSSSKSTSTSSPSTASATTTNTVSLDGIASVKRKHSPKNRAASTSSDDSASDSDTDTAVKAPDVTDEVGFIVGHSSFQGKRPYNEDRYSVHSPLRFPHKKYNHIRSWNFFAVMDGHGGHNCASIAANRLHQHVTQCYTSLKKQSYSDHKQRTLQKSYAAMDAEILAIQKKTFNEKLGVALDKSGTTCASCIVDHNEIVCANIGDTRCLLSRSLPSSTTVTSHKSEQAGRDYQCIELTIDHKPIDKEERLRIERAGGRVTIPIIPDSWLTGSAKQVRALKSQASGGYAELNDKGKSRQLVAMFVNCPAILCYTVPCIMLTLKYSIKSTYTIEITRSCRVPCIW